VRSPLASGMPMEIDILGVNGMKVVAVECKSRLSKDDVDEMIERLTNFKTAFPEYAQYSLYGAVAGIEINEGVDVYAYRKGLFVIRTNGESVEIANDDQFQPMTWG
jgi:CRISPR/Cas system-associated protein Cas7 (RAMP superfamily)